MEKAIFNNKSYYYNLERALELGLPILDILLDVDHLDEEVLEEARKEGLLFIEDSTGFSLEDRIEVD